MPLTPNAATELLSANHHVFEARLELLKRRVKQDKDTPILLQQLPDVALQALKAVASGQKTFNPTSLAASRDELSEKDPLKAYAFIEGDFGSPPCPHQCLSKIFHPGAGYRKLFQGLGEKYCDDEDLLRPLCDAVWDGIKAIEILKKNLSKECLGEYFGAMREMIAYAASPTVQAEMEKDIEAFKTLGQAVITCFGEVNKLYAQPTVAEGPQQKLQKNIQKIQRNLDDILIYFDKRGLYSLEGQGNAKPEQASAERKRWDRFCAYLVQFFRLVTTILTFGRFRHENPLAKKMGYGTFFFYKPKTAAEINDISAQNTSIQALAEKLQEAKGALDELSAEVLRAEKSHAPGG